MENSTLKPSCLLSETSALSGRDERALNESILLRYARLRRGQEGGLMDFRVLQPKVTLGCFVSGGAEFPANSHFVIISGHRRSEKPKKKSGS